MFPYPFCQGIIRFWQNYSEKNLDYSKPSVSRNWYEMRFSLYPNNLSAARTNVFKATTNDANAAFLWLS